MGRPPCCDKVGIKKGPWTPEEDIILVSYIQEHGPGNWRSVPTNTGLLRCSKSCRLRWTNYLRPGIKRGNFTPHEEGMIIHLQALLGNKWAAIASYLPHRTDNDIKNYWNTHLKKKLNKFQSGGLDPITMGAQDSISTTSSTDHHHFVSKSFSDRRSSLLDVTSTTCSNIINPSISLDQSTTTSSCSTYASSTENISRLLQGWMQRSSSPTKSTTDHHHHLPLKQKWDHSGNSVAVTTSLLQCHSTKLADHELQGSGHHDHHQHLISNEEFESILSLDNLNNNVNNNNNAWDKSTTCDSTTTVTAASAPTKCSPDSASLQVKEEDNSTTTLLAAEKKLYKSDTTTTTPPLSFLEKWLLDESSTAGQVEEIMQLSPIF